MKNWYLLFFVVLLISCEKEKINKLSEKKTEEQEVIVSNSQNFLNKFKTIDFDTLKVFSAEDIYDENFEYKGKLLDESDSIFFPKEISIFDMKNVDAFAVYKFDIDKNYLGLIARVGGEYDASSVKFFIYNKQKAKIKLYLELANSEGDAGFVLNIQSWIIKEENTIRIFKWINETYDNSVEEEPKTPNYKKDKYFQLTLKNDTFDTINMNYKDLEINFQKLSKKSK